VRSIESVARVARSIDAGVDGGLAHRVLTLAPGSDDAATTASLRSAAGVVDVQPVHLRVPLGDAFANDPLLDNVNQWYLYRTNVDPGAWQLTHGRASVSVAVIDTGVDETNTDFVFDFRESVVGGVRNVGAGSVQDTNGHGTSVAGLATAAANNSYGFAGVGYATHLQAYRVFPPATAVSDCQTADGGDEAVAIRDAVANGASVINLSLGSPQSKGVDAAERDAVAFAIAQGVVVVAAAGNAFPGTDGNVPEFPAGYPGVIAVGASAVQDATPNVYASIVAETVASYSNSGPTLVAPGGDATASDTDELHWIESYSTTTAAFAGDRCSNSGGVCRVLFTGTSQAAPQVAGTVALMEAFHGGPRSISPANALLILTQNADPLTGVSSTRQGAGRLNAGRAVAAAHP
jgi:subtilisin family serine protease